MSRNIMTTKKDDYLSALRRLEQERKAKLTDIHSQFLVEFIDKHPISILSDIRQSLCDVFPGFSISISALHRHLVQKCKVTLKRLQKLPAARSSDQVIKLRKEIVEQWEAMPDLDFAKNCLFIDEAGFNLHTQRNYGRSLKDTPAKSTVPTARGVKITILGAISQAGIILVFKKCSR